MRAFAENETYFSPMTVSWIDRIAAAIGASDLAYREISRQAGLGINFISQLLKTHKQPNQQRLEAISEAVNVSASWVLSGHPENPQLDRVIAAAMALPQDRRMLFFAILGAKSETPVSTIDKIVAGTNVEANQLFDALRLLESTDQMEDPKPPAKNIPSEDDFDSELFALAYEEALKAERKILEYDAGQDARLEMTKIIYDLLKKQRSKEI